MALLDADCDDDPDAEFYATTPFACGQAFSVSVLDSILATAYFNENMLTFLSTLVNGGVNDELASLLADEVGLQPPERIITDRQLFKKRDRCRLGHVSVKQFVSKWKLSDIAERANLWRAVLGGHQGAQDDHSRSVPVFDRAAGWNNSEIPELFLDSPICDHESTGVDGRQ